MSLAKLATLPNPTASTETSPSTHPRSPIDEPPRANSAPPPPRPKFNSHLTSDRLREGSGLRPPPFSSGSSIRKGRKSVFKELGLDDDDDDDEVSACASSFSPAGSRSAVRQPATTGSVDVGGAVSPTSPRTLRKPNPRLNTGASRVPDQSKSERTQTQTHITAITPSRSSRNSNSRHGSPTRRHTLQTMGTGDTAPTARSRRRLSAQSRRRSTGNAPPPPPDQRPWYARLLSGGKRPKVEAAAPAPVSGLGRVQGLALLVAAVTVVFPSLVLRNGEEKVEGMAEGGVLGRREDSPTGVCKRWAHQVAQVNGTMYIYGGQTTRDSGQTQNTWNNYFLTLDLTESWDTDSPRLKGLTIPDGPPPVSLGYLWQDYSNLYLYGGQFADNPYVDPWAESLWRYEISSRKWTEFSSPETASGLYSTQGDLPVHRAAEGAGISVPELGLSWYFGGHLDWATTPGWSRQTPRVFLKSLLEWTHPGYTNDAVDALENSGAGEAGVFRNITEGGVQAEGFPERADGVLVFVPGWGESGVLIGMGGGTWDSFADDLRVLDVYDIKTSKWFHQETTGDAPSVRVNPCAVVAGAEDASSFQVYLFGGQSLPGDDQTQYNDMYILSIPSFTWIKVSSSRTPAPRAGHTCTLRDGQMILLGGYVPSLTCDSPGVYVFDASTLEWTSGFKAGDHAPDADADNTIKANSWGYRVPELVREVIGGGEEGGATATTPGAGATDGPFATGKPPVYTVTEGGRTETVTRWESVTGTRTDAKPTETGAEDEDGDDEDEDDEDGDGEDGQGDGDDQGQGEGDEDGEQDGQGGDGEDGPNDSPPDDLSPANPTAPASSESPPHSNAGLIASGVIAGILALLAGYLAFCLWVYKRQIAAYKRHLAIANRYSGASSTSFLRPREGGAGAGAGAALLGKNKSHKKGESIASSNEDDMAWLGGGVEPKWMAGEGYGSSGGSGGSERVSESRGGSATGSGTRVEGRGSGSGSGSGHGGNLPGGVGVGKVGDGAEREKGGDEGDEGDEGSRSSTEALMDGREPSFFSVILGPRRALRVVNGVD